uniref:3-hydroxyacyl-CoA dehydrogenase NAD binding domain-containing protein n=1 Tax=Gopherus agassizii TaxID=38772 RepID=A0A452J5H0_9SAUR
MEPTQAGQVVVIGSGLIGRSWAMVFAGGGFKVKLYDVVQQQITSALEYIRKEMKELEKSGMLKGTLNAEKQLSFISGCIDLKTAVDGAMFIQGLLADPLMFGSEMPFPQRFIGDSHIRRLETVL